MQTNIILIVLNILLLGFIVYFITSKKSTSTSSSKHTINLSTSSQKLYPVFVLSDGQNQQLLINRSISFDTSSNILQTDIFKGDLNGTADSARSSNIIFSTRMPSNLMKLPEQHLPSLTNANYPMVVSGKETPDPIV